MIAIKLAGITFQDLPFIKLGDMVTIRHMTDNPKDSAAHPAYAVLLGEAQIGWIPSLESKNYDLEMAKGGFIRNDIGKFHHVGLRAAEKKVADTEDEIKYIIMARDWIRLEIEHNEVVPLGKVSNLLYKHGGEIVREQHGSPCSISIVVEN